MNKQIEEMAELERLLRIRRIDIEKQGCDIWALIKKTESEEQSIADYLIGQGYRKSSDVEKELADWKAIAEQYQKQFEDCYEEKAKIASKVAREIFEDIEQAIFAHGTKYAMKRLEELKKKYEVMDDGK